MAGDAAGPGPTLAQLLEQATPQVAQAERQWRFEIPAQELASALLAFAEATGIQVVFKSEDVAGIRTEGVAGEASAEEALRTLLGSSGLSYRFASASSVVVGAGVQGESSEGDVVALDTVRIEALRSITSYLPTDGYVSYYSVAATKTDTPVVETPQSISTIGREEMDARGVNTVAEALRYSPGVSLDAYGVDPRGYDSITIRGFYSASTGSFRDGLRMDGNVFAVYTTEPYGIERIDVMRGPSGALYGQAEAGGAIDRTTKRPRADMIQELQVEAGSWNHFQGAFDLGAAAVEDGSLLFRLTGLVRDANTEFDYNDGSEQDNDRIFFAPALTWAPTENTSLTILTDYMKDSRSTIFGTFGNEVVGRTNVVAGEPGFDRFDQEQFAIGYNLTHRFDDMWSFRQTARYTYVDVDYQTVVANFLDADNVTLQRYVWAAPDTLNQFAIDNQLESRFTLGPTHQTVLAGFDYSRSVDEFSYHTAAATPLNINNVVYSGATVPAPYQVTEQTLEQIGVYLQDQIELYDNWILTLGGRYSWVELQTDDLLANTSETKRDTAFTGRAGLTYLFENGLAPYVSYTEGFVPTEGTDFSGESFEPEESVQYEIGLKYQPPTINALFTASAFQLTKTNVLTRDPANINASVQAGEVRSRGIELEAKASLFDGWNIAASYTYLDAEVTKSNDIDKGKRPVIVPEHSAAAWVNYHVPEGPLQGLGLGGGVRYVGSSYNDRENTSENPAFVLFDAALSYDLGENLSFQVTATNLLDKEFTTTCAFGSCFYGPGRQVIGTLSYHW